MCSKLCLNFPVQTCSSLCGAIAIVFIAVVANCPQEVWQYVCLPHLQVNRLRPKLVLYQQPSEYAPYIRKVLAGWILTKKIDITNIVDRSIFDMLPSPRNRLLKTRGILNLKRKQMLPTSEPLHLEKKHQCIALLMTINFIDLMMCLCR